MNEVLLSCLKLTSVVTRTNIIVTIVPLKTCETIRWINWMRTSMSFTKPIRCIDQPHIGAKNTFPSIAFIIYGADTAHTKFKISLESFYEIINVFVAADTSTLGCLYGWWNVLQLEPSHTI